MTRSTSLSGQAKSAAQRAMAPVAVAACAAGCACCGACGGGALGDAPVVRVFVAVPIIAGIARLVRGGRTMSGSWLALGGAMLCWAAGMAATMAGTLGLDVADPERLSMLLYVLYGVPIIFALASPTGDDWKVRLLDGALSRTSVSGLFAAGDLRSGSRRQT